MTLWDKGTETNHVTGDFTSGKDRELDLHLASYDVLGTIAHVRMLESIGLLTKNELSAFEKELKVIYRMIEAGEFKIEPGVEDVHSQIELMLTEALGETGKKVHTARSRNDQVLLDLKLFVRDKLMEIVNQTVRLSGTLINLSNKHKGTLMPGYTHMQVAMPSSFGLWFGAYSESLTEDMILLQAAYSITNQNPLGSAAGFGSSFPIDRSMTTELLGFDNMHVNVVNAQMNRGKMEKTVAFALGGVGATLSRMAGDICTWSGQNFGFMTLPDEFTTGSSIMPHKKNPDIFELIRATGNKLQALPVEIMLISSNLPSGYHRDYQLIKENFIPAFNLLINILSVTEMVIGRITVNPEIIDKEIYNDLFSVEEVNRLVKQGVPFREAYKQVAGRIGNKNYKPLRELDHTHAGSMGNLCNELILEKTERIKEGFDFQKVENAMINLLK